VHLGDGINELVVIAWGLQTAPRTFAVRSFCAFAEAPVTKGPETPAKLKLGIGVAAIGDDANA
jgi:hypothetical protein